MLTVTGVALVLVALRDVVHELFHPELSGSVSRFLARMMWRVIRAAAPLHRAALHHAGPLMLVAIGAAWVALVAVGAALIYTPRLPQEFNVSQTLPRSAQQGFGTALYLSVATMTAVGSSDLSPKAPLVRATAAFEPIVGLVLITAWISWVLSIYPIIARRRAFSREVDLLRRADTNPTAFALHSPPDLLAPLLLALTTQVVRVTSDLAQAHVTYYFQNEQQHLALGAQLPYVLALARAAEAREDEAVLAYHGARLRLSITDLLSEISVHHLGVSHAPPERIIEALARDHMLDARLLAPNREVPREAT